MKLYIKALIPLFAVGYLAVSFIIYHKATPTDVHQLTKNEHNHQPPNNDHELEPKITSKNANQVVTRPPQSYNIDENVVKKQVGESKTREELNVVYQPWNSNMDNQEKLQCLLTTGHYDGDMIQCNLDNFILNNKLNYAIKHNYALLEIPFSWLFYEEIHNQRAKVWAKLSAIEHALKTKCSKVLWIDVDALITNVNLSIDNILDIWNKQNNNNNNNKINNINALTDEKGNGGVLIFTKSNKTFEFFKKTNEKVDFYNVFDFEQGAMTKTFNQMSNDDMFVVARWNKQASKFSINEKHSSWKNNDFIIHFTEPLWPAYAMIHFIRTNYDKNVSNFNQIFHLVDPNCQPKDPQGFRKLLAKKQN